MKTIIQENHYQKRKWEDACFQRDLNSGRLDDLLGDTKSEVSDSAKDFIAFIMSAEGQGVIEANGYIAVAEDAPAFDGGKVSGKIVIAGSSSVTPVMEKLKEA